MIKKCEICNNTYLIGNNGFIKLSVDSPFICVHCIEKYEVNCVEKGTIDFNPFSAFSFSN